MDLLSQWPAIMFMFFFGLFIYFLICETEEKK